MHRPVRVSGSDVTSRRMPGVVVSAHRPVAPDGSCRLPVEHTGSRSPRALCVYWALHGRPPCPCLLCRSALESFVSAQRWTHELVSAAGARTDIGDTRAVLDAGAEASWGRGSSPVAEAVPSHNRALQRGWLQYLGCLWGRRKTLSTVPRSEPAEGAQHIRTLW